MSISDTIKRKLQRFLNITEEDFGRVDVTRYLTFEGNAAKNLIWYNGDAVELSQFFGEVPNCTNSFWGATETKGLEIRKIHSGLPNLMVTTLANIILPDFEGVNFDGENEATFWEEFASENNLKNLLKMALEHTLAVGDGAFKISFDEELSDKPILEYYGGEDVDFTVNKGRVKEVKFYTRYIRDNQKYTLEEVYGYGYINYYLYEGDEPVPLEMIPETAGLEDVFFDKRVILATPFKIYESGKYKNRGKSIFEGKSEAFDGLDEVLSQWLDAFRAGRTKTYIPETLIPKSPEGGSLMKPNAFDNRYISVASDMQEGAKNEIKTVQGEIPVDGYERTYCTFLDLCLQGILSPSTLGIDVKKLDNAESQREKEKVTLYTRQSIIEALNETLKKVVKMVFYAEQLQYGKALIDEEFTITFGEYANPSFEALVETMSNPNTPMSLETKIEEIWGDSKDDEWKAKEAERIRKEKGYIMDDFPSFSESFKNPEGTI